MLEYLAPRDQNLSWFFSAIITMADYYPALKASNFLNELIYVKIAEDSRLIDDSEIIRQFECLTPEHFRIAFFICQHLYVRIQSREKAGEAVRTHIRRGMCVLYHYVYCYIGRNSEQTILKQIHQLKDIVVTPVDPLDTLHEWCLINFRTEHGIFAPEPKYIINVPWVQCCSIVGRKHGTCPLRNGFALLVYTQATRWISERWKCIVKVLNDHDHALIDPWFIHQYAIHKPIIMKQAEDLRNNESEYAIWKGRYYDQYFYDPARDMLLSGKYYNYDEIARPDFDPAVALDPLYASIFSRGREMDTKLIREERSKVNRDDLDFHNKNETGDFFVDYESIMPQCIRGMYTKHITQKTHFRYDDRLTFFAWTFKMGIPLSSVNKMWSAMCAADARISKRDVPSLLAVPGELYRKYTLNKERGQNYNFKGCAKMAQHCIFAANPDITERKIMCSQLVCGNNEGRALPAPKFWNPTLATIILHKRNHVQVELDTDLV